RYTFDLAGDGGLLQYDSAGDPGVVFDAVASARHAAGDGFLPDVSTMRDPYAAEIVEFAAALAGGTPSRVDAADGALAVEVAHAAGRADELRADPRRLLRRAARGPGRRRPGGRRSRRLRRRARRARGPLLRGGLERLARGTRRDRRDQRQRPPQGPRAGGRPPR